MDAAAIAFLDQTTIGPKDLRAFIEALDDVSDAVPGHSPDEIAHITADLRVTLGKWHQCIARNTDCDSIDQILDRETHLAQDRIDFKALQNIELHLSRLVLRQSNYGFAIVNVPSELDRFFPQTALTDLRKAHGNLRRVLSNLPIADPTVVRSSTPETEPNMAVVMW